MKFLIVVLSLASTILPTTAALTPAPPVELAGTHGKFDFIKVDSANRRLLACHTGNGSLDVIDLDKSQLIKSIPTGNAQGVAIDEKGGRYFVSCSKPPQLVIIDSAKLEVTGEVPLPAPADLCAFCGFDQCVYVDNDEKPEMWTIDVLNKKVGYTRSFTGGGMEDIGSSPFELLQNLKDTSELAWIQVVFDGGEHLRPTGKFSTLPAEKPHGLAMLEGDAVLIAGGTGKLVLLNYKSGKVLASCDIAPRVDEIAYDPELARVYCASGTGQISVVFVAQDKLTPLETVPSAPGCHSIAVDPKTHTVWIAYAKDDKPVVQAFTDH